MSKTDADALLRYVRKNFDHLTSADVESLYQALLGVQIVWLFRRLDAARRRDFLRHIGVPADSFDWRDADLPAAYRFERLGEGA
ncbi:hypothetical protein LG047_12770 [Methylocystis sp. WRRC1]|uniref:hypothetical protein n=1 Tax=unclassified Methylocystis TaxID=2625913 RepID=UPI0001F8683F|nr:MULTISPECIES: hypothetical protein [unclassified Methylocystis]MCC3246183.1 hypothetical protein [Methylocystis sp. WRRC1]